MAQEKGKQCVMIEHHCGRHQDFHPARAMSFLDLSIRQRSEDCSRGHRDRPSNGKSNVDADVGHDGELVGDGGACIPQVGPKQLGNGAPACAPHMHHAHHPYLLPSFQCLMRL